LLGPRRWYLHVAVEHAAGSLDQVIEPAQCIPLLYQRTQIGGIVHSELDAMRKGAQLTIGWMLDY